MRYTDHIDDPFAFLKCKVVENYTHRSHYQLMTLTLPLCKAVQRNCDISDAHHASDYSLCIYLLKMREFYRWESGGSYSDSLSKDEIGNWLTEREQHWDDLQDAEFAPLEIQGQTLDPFDTENINRLLIPKGYVYSGGLGVRATPHFFLARLLHREVYDGFEVLISAEECARDLTSPPAMALGNTIFIRRDSLRRMIWEKVQEWRWNQNQNAMARAMSFYDFETDTDSALEQMTDNELDAVTLHEIGEVMSTRYLGKEWHDMIMAMPRSRGELMARAVRDHLADSLSTLPALLEDNNTASLHFYMANLAAMRKELFPAFTGVYQQWLDSQDMRPIKKLVARSVQHWLHVGTEMLSLYRKHGDDCGAHMESLLATSQL